MGVLIYTPRRLHTDPVNLPTLHQYIISEIIDTSGASGRLFDRVRDAIRARHYSRRTELLCQRVLNRGGKGVRYPPDDGVR